MACCTTISPVSSPKKRGASSMFDVLPRTTKRRRGGLGASTTMITTLNSTNSNPMTLSSNGHTNTSNISAFLNFATPHHSTTSCFDVNIPQSSSYSHHNSFEADDSSSSSDTDDIMHRIKKEAKRLLKRKVRHTS